MATTIIKFFTLF